MKAWRPEDDALLERLEDEELLERVYRELAGKDAPLPHPRAAGLFARMRRTPEGRALVLAASDGDLAPLVRAIAQPDPARTEPELAHHLALLLATLAARTSDPARSLAARVRSISLWLRLAAEAEHLRALAAAVIGSALSKDEIREAADAAPFEAIDALGEQARAGARELSTRSSTALSALGRVPEAAAMAGCDDKLAAKASARAARARASAIDAAIARIDHALDEAHVRAAPAAELRELFDETARVWRWAGKDEHVERFLIERSTPFCWELYRERRWPDLRTLLTPMLEPMESLAARIDRDKTKLAYAAPCAQYFVFQAEMAPTFDRQLALAERSIALCPTHRNGRLVLADLLVERGLRALDTAMPWTGGDALDKAERDVRRAHALFPMLERLVDAKKRLEAMGRKIDG